MTTEIIRERGSMYRQHRKLFVALEMLLMHPAVLLVNRPKETHRSTRYKLKLPKTRADLEAIELAKVRQLKRGMKQRDNWINSLAKNPTVTFEQYQRSV